MTGGGKIAVSLAPAAGLVLFGMAAAAAGSESPAPGTKSIEQVKISFRETGAGVVLEAANVKPVAAELIIEERGSTKAADVRILPPLSTTTIFEFAGRTRAEAADHVRSTYRFVSYMGDPSAIHPDAGHLYRLPFREAKTYRLSQGFDGKESHDRDTSRYALDFQLEIGEPVHAARAGTVVNVVDWFREAGDRSRIDEANLIVVLHDDGTMAHYVHLDHEGALVTEGERVERGQRIGTSGMTGFTRGPHLHFVVRRERDIAVPIRFEGYEDRDLSKPGRFRVPGPRRDR